MKLLIVATLFLSANMVFSSDETVDETEQYLYNDQVFKKLLPTHPHFVMFFAPWCGHCNAMKEEWNKLAVHYNEDEQNAIAIVKVDCTENKDLCKSEGVEGFPTMQLYMPGKDAISYDGAREFEELKKFVTDALEGNNESVEDKAEKATEPKKEEEQILVDGLYNLTGMTFYRETMRGDIFVLFIDDGCEICEKVKQPWKKIAVYYEDNEDVKIGQVDCLKDKDICGPQGVLGTPVLKFYREGKMIESRSISADTKDLKAYIDRKLSEAPAEGDTTKILKLTNETINDVISTGITFIKIYHPMCGFCIRMELAWERLAKEDFSDAAGPVVIAELNCQDYDTTCREIGIAGFPTLSLFMNGEIISRFGGYSPRFAPFLKEYVLQMSNGYQPKDHVRDEL